MPVSVASPVRVVPVPARRSPRPPRGNVDLKTTINCYGYTKDLPNDPFALYYWRRDLAMGERWTTHPRGCWRRSSRSEASVPRRSPTRW